MNKEQILELLKDKEIQETIISILQAADETVKITISGKPERFDRFSAILPKIQDIRIPKPQESGEESV